MLDDSREIPAWIDATLQKALHPSPERRYQELSEFLYDLRHPNPALWSKARPPWIERNPAAFWKSICAVLALIIVALLIKMAS